MATSIPAPPSTRSEASRRTRRYIYIVVVALATLSAIPLLIVGGTLLWERSNRNGDTPRWVTPAVIRATTSDGMAVKAQVSLDIGDADARSEVEHHMDQVGLLLQATFAEHTKAQLAADGGLASLTDDMRDRLNDYLRADGASAVRSVVVADIFYSRP